MIIFTFLLASLGYAIQCDIEHFCTYVVTQSSDKVYHDACGYCFVRFQNDTIDESGIRGNCSNILIGLRPDGIKAPGTDTQVLCDAPKCVLFWDFKKEMLCKNN